MGQRHFGITLQDKRKVQQIYYTKSARVLTVKVEKMKYMFLAHLCPLSSETGLISRLM
jgi:hypothetical protein